MRDINSYYPCVVKYALLKPQLDAKARTVFKYGQHLTRSIQSSVV